MGAFTGGYAIVDNIVDVGDLSFSNVNDNSSVRPVVSLRSDAITGGSGTSSDPFYVDEKPTFPPPPPQLW